MRVPEDKKRTVTYDIETSFNIGGYFGRKWDVNIAKVIQKSFVMGFAWKYLDKPRIYSCYIWDFPLYKKDPRNDVNVIKKWIEVMSDPSVVLVVGQNNNRFDDKVMYGRLLIHGFPPMAMPPTADTLKMSRKIAAYDSHKLDDMMEQFGYGNKIKTDNDLWWDCMMGVKRAQNDMVKYNKRDVEGTEKVYLHLLPHSPNHPHMGNLTGRPDACKHCAKNVGFVGNGYDYTKTGKFKRWQCLGCRGNNRSRTGEKQRLDYV